MKMLFFMLLSILVIVPTGLAQENVGVLIVGEPDGQYKSIQAAIDAANPGDTIRILPGTYKESLSISKEIKLEGSSRDEVTIMPEEGKDLGIFVRGAKNFSIRSVTVIASGAAINVSRSSGQIEDAFIAGGRFGISFSGTGMTLEVLDSHITCYDGMDNEEYIETRLAGIYAYGNATLIAENCVFERNGVGISLTNDLKYKITGCTFKRNTVGVSLGGNATGSLSENVVTENIENGILINSSSETRLENNIFFGNIWHGLDLYLNRCTECECGGDEFNGTVVGSGNRFESEDEICPIDFWDESFYSFDENLGKLADKE
ncbi:MULTISPECIES: right-handed parallel beta-helix repeat-containing protein [Mesotoga]|uniref:right-handed parallel beta-helix repeat-containing protein n=3 Tax=Kosmotogaceae TaxID=1643948 RepID=UPI0002C976C1|nr:right-handed parallel beta-helix repeat-containing protein [Mesotoga prima]CCU85091.1 conserved exported hypothetical protein [Mesotoga infera]HNQ71567.1 right-handed parallel beta-helix repeat-containing protein [Mesotoga prima]HNS76608.1 right-handed parallel beta-helix repeat-containing protein [Mesotoga prima]HPJ33007.1 right-handed parallel beta-helix repeat-containing protein [Mesotoga prima]HQC14065.1 right-handed parallel beta-helix repeat-containing protein [Mesotoga prima]